MWWVMPLILGGYGLCWFVIGYLHGRGTAPDRWIDGWDACQECYEPTRRYFAERRMSPATNDGPNARNPR